jgi:hypothetical protein
VRGLPIRTSSSAGSPRQLTVTSTSGTRTFPQPSFKRGPNFVVQVQHFSSPSSFQMTGPSKLAVLQRKNPDDVVITMAIRSPLCKAKKGGFRDMRSVPFFLLWTISQFMWPCLFRSDELLAEMFRVRSASITTSTSRGLHHSSASSQP